MQTNEAIFIIIIAPMAPLAILQQPHTWLLETSEKNCGIFFQAHVVCASSAPALSSLCHEPQACVISTTLHVGVLLQLTKHPPVIALRTFAFVKTITVFSTAYPPCQFHPIPIGHGLSTACSAAAAAERWSLVRLKQTCLQSLWSQ